jgi:hypothetical protein
MSRLSEIASQTSFSASALVDGLDETRIGPGCEVFGEDESRSRRLRTFWKRREPKPPATNFSEKMRAGAVGCELFGKDESRSRRLRTFRKRWEPEPSAANFLKKTGAGAVGCELFEKDGSRSRRLRTFWKRREPEPSATNFSEKMGAGAVGCELLAEDALPYVVVFGISASTSCTESGAADPPPLPAAASGPLHRPRSSPRTRPPATRLRRRGCGSRCGRGTSGRG